MQSSRTLLSPQKTVLEGTVCTPVHGRYNNNGYECADLCAWTFGSNTYNSGGGLANVNWPCSSAAKKYGCTSRNYLVQVSAQGILKPCETLNS
jgi:hypothetical protein